LKKPLTPLNRHRLLFPVQVLLHYKNEFGFFETDNCYAIYLIGSEEHEKKDNVSAAKNDDEQPAEYYPLSKREYKDLEWKQALNKMKAQLAEFTWTEKFKNSSLAKANAVTIGFDDGDLIKIK
jgi:hypothetical protein